VPLEAICEIADILDLHPAEVHDVMSFYGFFRDEKQPLGRHRVWVCRSLSCMLCGGEKLLAELCRRLGVQPGQTTAPTARSRWSSPSAWAAAKTALACWWTKIATET